MNIRTIKLYPVSRAQLADALYVTKSMIGLSSTAHSVYSDALRFWRARYRFEVRWGVASGARATSMRSTL